MTMVPIGAERKGRRTEIPASGPMRPDGPNVPPTRTSHSARGSPERHLLFGEEADLFPRPTFVSSSSHASSFVVPSQPPTQRC